MCFWWTCGLQNVLLRHAFICVKLTGNESANAFNTALCYKDGYYGIFLSALAQV